MAGFAESTDAWTRTWMDAQKQYMDVWLKLSRQQLPWQAATSPFPASGTTPWAESFQQWSKLFGQSMPANAKDVSARLFDLGKSYLSLSESFWKTLQQGKDAAAWTRDWQDMLKDTCQSFAKDFKFPGGAGDPWSGFANLWGLPLNNWQRMACAFSPFPGEMERALREENIPAASEMTRTVRHFMSVPPVGYTREWQEQLQDWTRLHMEYLHSVQDFGGLLAKVVQRALELFGERVTARIRAGEPFDGLRAVYDLWIDCGEDAYAELVETTEFPHLQAEMVNALMRMKSHEQLMVQEFMTALNMPTRAELDTTHKRVYELQRQVRQLQDALEELAGNEAEAHAEAPPPAAPIARSASPRKKAASKKAASKKAASKKAVAKKTSGTARRRAQPKARKG
ncbi:MAG: class III poly(R)-hydroxyalkanoic acid synthase subunit PhaE [Gammaproteobacteria bacterium]|jgi:class III poly(R)-hydroxyalkanoic acid synthase PhaE subunit